MDRFVAAVKPRNQADEAAAEDLALLVDARTAHSACAHYGGAMTWARA